VSNEYNKFDIRVEKIEKVQRMSVRGHVHKRDACMPTAKDLQRDACMPRHAERLLCFMCTMAVTELSPTAKKKEWFTSR